MMLCQFQLKETFDVVFYVANQRLRNYLTIYIVSYIIPHVDHVYIIYSTRMQGIDMICLVPDQIFYVMAVMCKFNIDAYSPTLLSHPNWVEGIQWRPNTCCQDTVALRNHDPGWILATCHLTASVIFVYLHHHYIVLAVKSVALEMTHLLVKDTKLRSVHTRGCEVRKRMLDRCILARGDCSGQCHQLFLTSGAVHFTGIFPPLDLQYVSSIRSRAMPKSPI